MFDIAFYILFAAFVLWLVSFHHGLKSIEKEVGTDFVGSTSEICENVHKPFLERRLTVNDVNGVLREICYREVTERSKGLSVISIRLALGTMAALENAILAPLERKIAREAALDTSPDDFVDEAIFWLRFLPIPRAEREQVMGDLEEEFYEVLSLQGEQRAKLFLRAMLIKSFWPYTVRFFRSLLTIEAIRRIIS